MASVQRQVSAVTGSMFAAAGCVCLFVCLLVVACSIFSTFRFSSRPVGRSVGRSDCRIALSHFSALRVPDLNATNTHRPPPLLSAYALCSPTTEKQKKTKTKAERNVHERASRRRFLLDLVVLAELRTTQSSSGSSGSSSNNNNNNNSNNKRSAAPLLLLLARFAASSFRSVSFRFVCFIRFCSFSGSRIRTNGTHGVPLSLPLPVPASLPRPLPTDLLALSEFEIRSNFYSTCWFRRVSNSETENKIEKKKQKTENRKQQTTKLAKSPRKQQQTEKKRKIKATKLN